MGKFAVKHVNSGIRFELRAGNGEVIAASEVYTTKNSCMNGIRSVMKNAPLAAVEDRTEEGFAKEKHPKFEVYQDKGGEYRFRLKAANGQVIAASEGWLPERHQERKKERRRCGDCRGMTGDMLCSRLFCQACGYQPIKRSCDILAASFV